MSETIQDRIKQRLAALGMSSRAASLQSGGSSDLIRGILRNPEGAVRSDSLQKLAATLQCGAHWLLTGEGPEPQPPAPWKREASAALVETPLDVPVRGTAAGALADTFKVSGETVDYVRRPPGLAKAKGLYAIFVMRSSMEPEHKPGELRFVHPHRPVKIGDSVVVKARWRETGEVESYIATFVGRTKTKVILRKHNPPAKVEIEALFVESVEKVLTVNELFGV